MHISNETLEGYKISCGCGHSYVEPGNGRYTECHRCGHTEEIDRLVLNLWQTVGWGTPVSMRMGPALAREHHWTPLR